MKKVLFIIAIFIFSDGCSILWRSTPSFVKKNFTFLYDGKYTGIDTLIDIQGFYIFPQKIAENNHKNVTCSIVIFFNNGISVAGMINFKDIDELYINTLSPIMIDDEYIIDEHKDLLDFYYILSSWGKYEIENDIIKVRYVKKGKSLNAGWSLSECWYKVLDMRKIQEIRGITYDSEHQSWNKVDYGSLQGTPLPSIFVPLATFPSSDGWIKNESWFWKNESDWQEYMEQKSKK